MRNVAFATSSVWTKSPSDWIGNRLRNAVRYSLNALFTSASGTPNTQPTHARRTDTRASRATRASGSRASRHATRQNNRHALPTDYTGVGHGPPGPAAADEVRLLAEDLVAQLDPVEQLARGRPACTGSRRRCRRGAGASLVGQGGAEARAEAATRVVLQDARRLTRPAVNSSSAVAVASVLPSSTTRISYPRPSLCEDVAPRGRSPSRARSAALWIGITTDTASRGVGGLGHERVSQHGDACVLIRGAEEHQRAGRLLRRVVFRAGPRRPAVGW